MPRTADPHRRADILHAARQAFEARPIRDVSMAEIAQRAGIAVGTLYLYFRSKDDIVRGLAADVFERAGRRIAVLLDRPLTRATLRRIVDTAIDTVAEEPGRVVEMAAERGDVAAPLAPAAFNAFVAEMAAKLEQQMARGTVRPYDDPAVLADYITILLRRAALVCAGDARCDRRSQVRTLVDLLARLLLPGDGRPSKRRRPPS